MRRALLMFLGLLALAACGAPFAADAPPTAIPICSTKDGKKVYDLVKQYAQEWDDADKLAQSTSRLTLSPQVAVLQRIRRDVQAQEYPPCGQKAQAKLVEMMDYTIEGYLEFLAEKPDPIVQTTLSRAQSAQVEFAAALGELSGAPTPTPIATFTATPTWTPAPTRTPYPTATVTPVPTATPNQAIVGYWALMTDVLGRINKATTDVSSACSAPDAGCKFAQHVGETAITTQVDRLKGLSVPAQCTSVNSAISDYIGTAIHVITGIGAYLTLNGTQIDFLRATTRDLQALGASVDGMKNAVAQSSCKP